MSKILLYQDFAKYYDLIYHWKDYKKESKSLLKLILKYKKSSGNILLEAGCGTGQHLQFLDKKFDCLGTDINQGILNVAIKKNKNVKFKKANMITMKLNKKFDVIISMFSSIGYVKSITNLKKTIQIFSNHLKIGGVVIIEPWFSLENFRPGTSHLTSYEDDNIKIARMNVSKKKKNISILDTHYLIVKKGKKVEYFKESHELGLFNIKKTLEIMGCVGLKSKFLKNGFMKDRGVFIGVKE